MDEFYGMKPGTISGFADAGSGKFISVEGLPHRTVTNMVAVMEKLRRMHEDAPLPSSLSPGRYGPGIGKSGGADMARCSLQS